jgi:hypothetical protein
VVVLPRIMALEIVKAVDPRLQATADWEPISSSLLHVAVMQRGSYLRSPLQQRSLLTPVLRASVAPIPDDPWLVGPLDGAA